MEFELLHRARGATANEGSSTAHEGSSLMAGGGAVLCIFWYQVGVKYHPTPLGAVKKMMRSNAESLMAGAGAVYLYFDTESMQNIIQSLIGRYENGLHRYIHRVQCLSSKQTVFNVHHFRLVTDIMSLWCPAFP